MTDSSIWNEEVAVPKVVISYVDPNVKESEYIILSIDSTKHKPCAQQRLSQPFTCTDESSRAPKGFDRRQHLVTRSILLDSNSAHPNYRPEWRSCVLLP